MKPLNIIIAIVIAMPITFFGLGLVLPTHSQVERSIEIDAPKGVVFHYVSNHRSFREWSPWEELDPNMVVTFAGPDYGLTSKMIWVGNDQVGEGVSEYTEIVPNEMAVTTLDFGEMGQGVATYELSEKNGNTHIVWRFETTHDSLAERYVGLFLDNLLGPVYEQGLQSLKKVAENAPPIATREMTYKVDGDKFTGYLAFPIGLIDPAPGVLVVHEWWGHNDYARRRAEMLAKEGYVAFALDMYGQGKQADHPDDAVKFMQQVGAKGKAAERRFDAAKELLADQYFSDSSKLAAIGYCFGGSVVINMARMGKNLNGVVSFHGGLGDLAPIADHAHTPVLAFNGGADPLVPNEHKQQFIQSMEQSPLDLEFIEYPGVRHAFTNPKATEMGNKFELPLEYNAEADEKSWEKAQTFLQNIFY